jgi:cupin 2 domain-containing protein
VELNNLHADIPAQLPRELVEILAEGEGAAVKRIVSRGHASGEEFWYDQDEHEWVLLVAGAARLQFEHETVELRPGDFLNIPAHRKHRVAWTAPDEPTIWLAVFYR